MPGPLTTKPYTLLYILGPEHSCAVKKGRRQVNKKFFELKNVEYRGGIKARRQDRDD